MRAPVVVVVVALLAPASFGLSACGVLGLQPLPCVDDGDCTADTVCVEGRCAVAIIDPVEGEGEEGEGEEGEGEGDGGEGEGEEGEGEGEGEEGEGEGEGDAGEGEGEGDAGGGEGEGEPFDALVDDDFLLDDLAASEFRTLTAAVDALATAGRVAPLILIAPGTYDEETLPLQLAPGTVLRGVGAAVAGADVVVPLANDLAFVGTPLRIEGITLTGGPAYDATNEDADIVFSSCTLANTAVDINNGSAGAATTHLEIRDSLLNNVNIFVTGVGDDPEADLLLSGVVSTDLDFQVFVTGTVVVEDSELAVGNFRSGRSSTSITTVLATRFTEGPLGCDIKMESGVVNVFGSTFSEMNSCAPLFVRDNNSLTDVLVDADFVDNNRLPIAVQRTQASSVIPFDFSDSGLVGACGVSLCICGNSLDNTEVSLPGGVVCSGSVAAHACPTAICP